MTDASVPGGWERKLGLSLGTVVKMTERLHATEAERDALKAERAEALAAMASDGADAMGENRVLRAEVWRLTAENAALRVALDQKNEPHRKALALIEREARLDERRQIEREIVAPLLALYKTPIVSGTMEAVNAAHSKAERWCAEVREQGGNP